MEHQLNNPLRSPVRAPRGENSVSTTSPSQPPDKHNKNPQPSSNPTTPMTSVKQSSSLLAESPSQISKIAQTSSSFPELDQRALLKPEVRKALDELNAPEELRQLMIQLAQGGLEIAGPKKTYIKHSYEVDQDLHQKFHEMYPVLGFKKVKDAINDAIASWCNQHEAEFRRRSGI